MVCIVFGITPVKKSNETNQVSRPSRMHFVLQILDGCINYLFKLLLCTCRVDGISGLLLDS